MRFHVRCPRCNAAYDADDGDWESADCPECGYDWSCSEGIDWSNFSIPSLHDPANLAHAQSWLPNANDAEHPRDEFPRDQLHADQLHADQLHADPYELGDEKNAPGFEPEYELTDQALTDGERTSDDDFALEGGIAVDAEVAAGALASTEALDWQPIAIAPRRKRTEASLARRFLPPILGGLSAFPIAIAILWYGFGRDLGNTGPTVARYVPWIVPEALRGKYRRRPPMQNPNGTTNRDGRDFGTLGGASRDSVRPKSAEVNLEEPKEAPRASGAETVEESKPNRRADVSAPKESSDAPWNQWDRLAARMMERHDAWEALPEQGWDELRDSLVTDSQAIAQGAGSLLASGASLPDWTDRSLGKLAQQAWYREMLLDVASDLGSKSFHPSVGDYLFWPIDSAKLERENASIDQDDVKFLRSDEEQSLDVMPRLTLDLWPVQWIFKPSMISDPSLLDGETGASRMILGQIDRLDDLGYVIRIEAIIP